MDAGSGRGRGDSSSVGFGSYLRHAIGPAAIAHRGLNGGDGSELLVLLIFQSLKSRSRGDDMPSSRLLRSGARSFGRCTPLASRILD
jgi:hypothetical protein